LKGRRMAAFVVAALLDRRMLVEQVEGSFKPNQH
jgi:hypothetical protein